MPLASKSITSSGIRRRRVTTACVACRDRRVRCDRIHPICTQCMKGSKRCKYTDQPSFDFVDHSRNNGNSTPQPGSWDLVMDNQVNLVRKADTGKEGGESVWAVAEAEEAAIPQPEILDTNEDTNEDASPSHIIPVAAIGDSFVSTLMNYFPSREVCQPMFEGFLRGIHPLVPICDILSLSQQYNAFWTTVSPSYSVEALALLLAALYTGATDEPPANFSPLSTILGLYEEIFARIDFGFYQPKNITASIQLLQSCVIMSTFKASQMSPFSAYGFLPQAIRFAQTLRLHSETKQTSAVDAGTRRRLWWHLLSLDIESTIATGLPPIIYSSSYTTQLPDLSEQGPVIGPDGQPRHSPNLPPIAIAMHGHYQWAQRIQSLFACLPSRDEVSKFKTTMEKLIAVIPDNNHTDNSWARLYLKMLIDRTYCMLGLRFWQLDQYKGTGCHSEVVETARSFLKHYLQLSYLPETTHFAWFVPGLIQPIHAVIILLMHLSTCPHIADEEASRSILDGIMKIRVSHIKKGSAIPTKPLLPSLQPSSTSHRSNPRYLAMVELRRRVWKKVGWDSDGKGQCPWASKRLQESSAGENNDAAPQLDEGISYDDTATLATSESTVLESLDSIFAGDPMDLFQWDEWEALASDFFAS